MLDKKEGYSSKKRDSWQVCNARFCGPEVVAVGRFHCIATVPTNLATSCAIYNLIH